MRFRLSPQLSTPWYTVKTDVVMLADADPSELVAVSENWPRPLIVALVVTTPPLAEDDPMASEPEPEIVFNDNVTGPLNAGIGVPLPSTARTCTTNGVPEMALCGCCTICSAHAPVSVVDGLLPDSEKPPPTADVQLPGDVAPQGTLTCSGTTIEPPGATDCVALDSVIDPVPCPVAVQFAGTVAAIVQPDPEGTFSVTELNDEELLDGLPKVAVSADVVPR